MTPDIQKNEIIKDTLKEYLYGKPEVIQKIKEQVCEAGLRLVREGLVARTWGNVSARVDDRRMVITPSGRQYEELTPGEMVLVDIYTLKYEGNLKPSSELKLHSEVYKTRPHIGAVIHTHQMYASIVGAAHRDAVIIDPDHQRILGGTIIKAAAYALPSTRAIVTKTIRALESANAALISNHGALCIGTDLDNAYEVSATLEKACALFIESKKQKVPR